MDKLEINELYAFIAENNEGEGICSFQMGDVHMPMVGADMLRIESLKKLAQIIATETGTKISICKFSKRELIETIKP